MTEQRPDETDKVPAVDRVGAAFWWLIFIGFPAAIVTLFATFFVNLPDFEVKRLCTIVAFICGAIGFIHGRTLPGLPWAKHT